MIPIFSLCVLYYMGYFPFQIKTNFHKFVQRVSHLIYEYYTSERKLTVLEDTEVQWIHGSR